MENKLEDVGNKRAILFTINSLYELAIENHNVLDIRIEFSSRAKMLNVFVFKQGCTAHIYSIVLLDLALALDDLLMVEDELIDRIAELSELVTEAV